MNEGHLQWLFVVVLLPDGLARISPQGTGLRQANPEIRS